MSIAGQIEFGDFLELDGLAVKYDFVAGGDWSLAGGDISGAGQHAFKSSYDINQPSTFEMSLFSGTTERIQRQLNFSPNRLTTFAIGMSGFPPNTLSRE